MNIVVKDFKTKMPENFLQDGIYDIDFCGELMIQFTREDGKLKITNAVNGYGENCFNEFKNEIIIISE